MKPDSAWLFPTPLARKPLSIANHLLQPLSALLMVLLWPSQLLATEPSDSTLPAESTPVEPANRERVRHWVNREFTWNAPISENAAESPLPGRLVILTPPIGAGGQNQVFAAYEPTDLTSETESPPPKRGAMKAPKWVIRVPTTRSDSRRTSSSAARSQKKPGQSPLEWGFQEIKAWVQEFHKLKLPDEDKRKRLSHLLLPEAMGLMRIEPSSFEAPDHSSDPVAPVLRSSQPQVQLMPFAAGFKTLSFLNPIPADSESPTPFPQPEMYIATQSVLHQTLGILETLSLTQNPLVHGDFKVINLIAKEAISPNETFQKLSEGKVTVCLMDWDSAFRKSRAKARLEALDDRIPATLRYVSPELFSAVPKEISWSSDHFSFARSLYASLVRGLEGLPSNAVLVGMDLPELKRFYLNETYSKKDSAYARLLEARTQLLETLIDSSSSEASMQNHLRAFDQIASYILAAAHPDVRERESLLAQIGIKKGSASDFLRSHPQAYLDPKWIKAIRPNFLRRCFDWFIGG